MVSSNSIPQTRLPLRFVSGNGRLITICDVDSPPAYPVMTQMNFPKELTANVLSSLNWGTADEEHTPSWVPLSISTVNVSSHIVVVLSAEPARGSYGSERHKTRLSKRKTASDALFSVREELFTGEFEGSESCQPLTDDCSCKLS